MNLPLLLACSGPDAADVIADSSLIALGALLGSLVLVVVIGVRAYRLRRRGLWLAFGAALVGAVFVGLLGLTLRAGDCGFTARYASMVVFAGTLGLTALTFTLKKPPAA